ncbi:MCP four helix bundle domain-containing protein [Marinoscillum furvescens]|uniref:Chemoreceptor-like protein with four helix bundle sensory module n=1 Tax=Marinoscillum furvescens DSM 4134 TaxID=1122208 RepID=A0A3D9L3P7_MARFU|nr:MCP four helix bundle domain-containing protein [Marinoscillum furvescens]RED97913.1 chemoreceptor-like protein with four helix bundle sensory module [Marinoscillum furvescens DSM 4134]
MQPKTWKDILNQKRNTALTLVSVFILFLMTCVLNKVHLTQLEESLEAIYQDRLMANGYIYQLADLLHQKEALLVTADSYQAEQNLQLNDSIASLISSYEKTRLTKEEAQVFEALKKHLRIAEKLEAQNEAQPALVATIKTRYGNAQNALHQLSGIQLYEGKNVLKASNQTIASNRMTVQLEIGLLIILGLMIHFVVSSQWVVGKPMPQ